MLLGQHRVLLLLLLQLGAHDLQISIDALNLSLLLLKECLELFLELLLSFLKFVLGVLIDFLFFLFEFLHSLVQNLDVQFQLLLHFDVVPDLRLVLLQLLLVLLWRQVN